MEQKESSTASNAKRQRSGKYLTFVLAEQEYGLEIVKVREIIGLMAISAIPQTPEYVKGVINLRGNVTPVIDLQLKFGFESPDTTEETCIIVVDVDSVELGIIVDKVSEVLDIAEGDIEDSPSFGAHVNTDFILGMAKTGERVTILLNINNVFSREDIQLARNASSDEEVA